MLSKSRNLQLLSRLPRTSILKDTSTSTTITPITSILKSTLTSSIRAFHFPTTHVGEVQIKILLLTKYLVSDFESKQRPKIRFIASTPSCPSCLCRWPRYTCSHKHLVRLESGLSVFRHLVVFGRLKNLMMHIHSNFRLDSAVQYRTYRWSSQNSQEPRKRYWEIASFFSRQQPSNRSSWAGSHWHCETTGRSCQKYFVIIWGTMIKNIVFSLPKNIFKIFFIHLGLPRFLGTQT